MLKKKNFFYRINEVTTLHNETQAALQEAKHVLENTIIREVSGVGDKVQETREVAKESIGELRYINCKLKKLILSLIVRIKL